MNRIETGLQITPLTGDTKALNVKGSSNLNSTYSIWAENLAGYELFKVRDDRTILFGNNLQGSTQIHADINDGGQLKVGSPTLQGKVSIQQSSGWGSYGLAVDMGSPTDTSVTGLYLRTRSTSGATAIGGSFITTAGGGSGSNISRAIYAEATGADFNQAIIVPSNGGNIGFGTSLPDSRLHVVGSDSTSSNYGLKVDNSASSPLLHVRNDGTIQTGDPASFSKLKLNPTGHMILSDQDFQGSYTISGGTSQIAVARLMVDSALDTDSNIMLQGKGALGGNAGNNAIYFGDSYKAFAAIKSSTQSPFKEGNLDFYTTPDNTVTNLQKRMTINKDGNVGIGISNPTSKLQVVGILEYTDNADALSNGLTAGAFYRTGDLLKVVH